eukprot:3781854-Rhodomonas_salina.1
MHREHENEAGNVKGGEKEETASEFSCDGGIASRERRHVSSDHHRRGQGDTTRRSQSRQTCDVGQIEVEAVLLIAPLVLRHRRAELLRHVPAQLARLSEVDEHSRDPEGHRNARHDAERGCCCLCACLTNEHNAVYRSVTGFAEQRDRDCGTKSCASLSVFSTMYFALGDMHTPHQDRHGRCAAGTRGCKSGWKAVGRLECLLTRPW